MTTICLCLVCFVHRAISWLRYSLFYTAWCSKAEFSWLILIWFYYYANIAPVGRGGLKNKSCRTRFSNKACVSFGTIFPSQTWQMESDSRTGSNLTKSHINVNYNRQSLRSPPWLVYTCSLHWCTETGTRQSNTYLPTYINTDRQTEGSTWILLLSNTDICSSSQGPLWWLGCFLPKKGHFPHFGVLFSRVVWRAPFKC